MGSLISLVAQPQNAFVYVTGKPEILEVRKVDGLTTSVKFSPHAPSLPPSCANLYKVNGYYIQSRFKDAEWVRVYKKVLPSSEDLQLVEEVCVPSHLNEKPRICEYRITLCYDCKTIGEVSSDTTTQIVDALGMYFGVYSRIQSH